MEKKMEIEASKFINNILQPWDRLNELLIQPHALDPDVSSPKGAAENIATEIRHLPETFPLTNKKESDFPNSYTILKDVSDYKKHGEKLKKSDRKAFLSVGSAFEYKDPEKFRFMRNIITINHPSLGRFDFLEISSIIIKYWMAQKTFSIKWRGAIKEASHKWKNVTELKYDPEHCPKMVKTQLHIFSKDVTGNLIPYNLESFPLGIKQKGHTGYKELTTVTNKNRQAKFIITFKNPVELPYEVKVLKPAHAEFLITEQTEKKFTINFEKPVVGEIEIIVV